MVFRSFLISLVLALFFHPSLMAHPGHGPIPSDEFLLHQLFSPMHLLPIIVMILFIAATGYWARRMRSYASHRPAAFSKRVLAPCIFLKTRDKNAE